MGKTKLARAFFHFQTKNHFPDHECWITCIWLSVAVCEVLNSCFLFNCPNDNYMSINLKITFIMYCFNIVTFIKWSFQKKSC